MLHFWKFSEMRSTKETHELEKYNFETMKENDYVIRAEILCTLHTVIIDISINASASSVKLFLIMFGVLKIAQKMALQKTKISHWITHGLTPCLQENLVKLVQKCDFYVDSRHNEPRYNKLFVIKNKSCSLSVKKLRCILCKSSCVITYCSL